MSDDIQRVMAWVGWTAECPGCSELYVFEDGNPSGTVVTCDKCNVKFQVIGEHR